MRSDFYFWLTKRMLTYPFRDVQVWISLHCIGALLTLPAIYYHAAVENLLGQIIVPESIVAAVVIAWIIGMGVSMFSTIWILGIIFDSDESNGYFRKKEGIYRAIACIIFDIEILYIVLTA